MPQKFLTYNKLAKLFHGLNRHYKDFKKNNPSAPIDVVHDELCAGLNYFIQQICKQKNIDFESLSVEEIEEAYKVVKFFLSSCDLQQSSNYTFKFRSTANVNLYEHESYYAFYNTPELFLDFWIIPIDSSTSTGEAAAQIILILGLIILAVLTAYAMYYLFKQMLNTAERFVYNEGLLRASLSILNYVVSLTASMAFFMTFLFEPFVSLSLAAGFSSLFPVFMGIGCLSIILGALGTYALDMAVHYSTSDANAMFPEEPQRYVLTPQNEKAILEARLDPIKVKCAIVALGDEIDAAETFIDRSVDAQQKLETIRELREGKVITKSILLNKMGNVDFDFRLPSHPTCAPLMSQFGLSFWSTPDKREFTSLGMDSGLIGNQANSQQCVV